MCDSVRTYVFANVCVHVCIMNVCVLSVKFMCVHVYVHVCMCVCGVCVCAHVCTNEA